MISSVMVGLKVLRNVGHVCPSLVAVLFSSAVWDIRPNHPSTGPSRRVDGSPVVCSGEYVMEAEVGVDGVSGLSEFKDELSLCFVEESVKL